MANKLQRIHCSRLQLKGDLNYIDRLTRKTEVIRLCYRISVFLLLVVIAVIVSVYEGVRRLTLIAFAQSPQELKEKPQVPRKSVFLCMPATGLLGNAMFTYASMFGVAKSKNMIPVYYERPSVIYRYFKHPTAVRNYDHCKGFIKHSNKQHAAFNSRDVAFSNQENASMDGYYQSWEYFKDSFEDIRKEFTFTDSIQNEARDAILNATSRRRRKKAHLTYVTVHARRGEILERSHFVKYGFISPGVEYYKKAMKLYRRKYRHVVFIVCSNRINWAKRYLNSSDVVFIEGHTAVVDMCVISQGNHTIMSVGTFGWWGSFLANGDTIASIPPARPGSVFRKQFSEDFSDFFLPHWTLIDG